MIPRKLAQTDPQNTDLVLSRMCKSFRKVGVSLGFSRGQDLLQGGLRPPWLRAWPDKVGTNKSGKRENAGPN